MCGICGIIDFHQNSASSKKETVALMNQALLHRGPDESGQFNDACCSLAMRRLSIIDLAHGQQPQYNADQSICVFQNGEIYNFQELKKELQEDGFVFKTNSDTEVLAHLYEAAGEALFSRLKGMFAICIYDLKKQMVLLARDRFGEKPCYYHWNKKVLSFSSEIKSLLANPHIERNLNLDALPYYFRTSLVPEPITLLQGIKSLKPGHYLKISKDQIVEQKYYHLTYKVNEDIKTEEDAIALIRPHLLEAVKRQTISDVPVGAFLSGGLDSSTIVALLQKNAAKPIPTFTARFEDQAYDESPIARKVASFCGTDHRELVIPNYDFEESIFWTIIDHIGLPFRDSSAIPSYFISKAIGQEVKVALSGDGGDELFGGYAMFQWQQKITSLQSIPKPIRQLGYHFLAQAKKIPGLNKVSKLRQIQRAIRTSFETTAGIPIALNEMFTEQDMLLLFPKDSFLHQVTGAFAYPILKEYPPEAAHWSVLRKAMYYRAIHTLPANMLIKVDRMSMANSLEVRAPFLDPDLFAAAAQLPDSFLIKGGKGKWLIRKIMEKELPAEVFTHPKMGFSIPLFKYKNEAFQQLAHKLLFTENPWPSLWSQKYLKTIYKNGLSNTQNTAQTTVFQSAHRLWMMMQLLGWAKRFKVQLPSK